MGEAMILEELEALREGWEFEAKLGRGKDGRGAVPRSLWETYSAMANTNGGKILIGAKEKKDGRLRFEGLIDVDRVEKELWDLLENPNKVSVNLLQEGDITRIEYEERFLLLLHIPKAPREHRPIFINGSREQGVYIRVHEGDRRASEEIIRRMIAGSIPERDSRIVDEFTLQDLSERSIRRYREVFAARRSEHPFIPKSDQNFLISIGAARRDRRSGEIHPTWAGLWMLGKESSIREVLPHWHLSFKELSDDPEDPQRWLDRIYPDGTWNANVFEFYLKVILKLHEGLKVPFAMKDGQFRLDETLAHSALREALVNTLVHADYQGPTGVRIIKKRSGFEFINPGDLLITPEQLWKGGLSVNRNPFLQRLFAFLRLGEREGSGGPAIRRAWQQHHWRAPKISVQMEHLETHLELSLESLLPDHAIQTLVDLLGQRFREQNELGRIILVTAYLEDEINHARIRELSDVHPRDITLKLQELIRQNLLNSSGHIRNKTYQLSEPEELPLFRESVPEEIFIPSKGTAVGWENAESSDPYAASSDAYAESSDAYAGSSDPYAESPDSYAGSSDPYAESSALALVRQTERAKRSLINAAILEFCAFNFCTTQEIALAIKRSESSVVDRYLPELIKTGQIELKYPHTPNHPRQAYRARLTSYEQS